MPKCVRLEQSVAVNLYVQFAREPVIAHNRGVQSVDQPCFATRHWTANIDCLAMLKQAFETGERDCWSRVNA
jgi:hypothetical protein